MKVKKLVSFILVAAMMLSVFVLPATAVNENEVVVHYYNENNWENPYIYYYNDGNTPVNWPGVAMNSDGDNWYSYTINNMGTAKVIFSNNGADQYPAQNQEGLTVSGEKWYKSGSFYSQNPDLSKITVHYYNTTAWSNPYIYYYTDSANPITWPGVAMTSDGNGWYSYNIYGYDSAKVIFSDNGSNQNPGQNEPGYSVSGEKWYVNGSFYDSEPNGITVHFYNYDNWNNVNLYYYSGNLEGTNWTGNPMFADGDGWYSYKIYGLDEARVLFNNGSGIQIPGVMEEGFLVSDEMWYRNGTWTDERPDEITVYFCKPDNWSTANIYYYLNDNDTGPAWPGTTMTEVSDGWYVYHITRYASAKVMFNDGNNQIPAQNQPGLDASGVMWYKNGVWCDSETDTDEDELPDYMELLLGTNINGTDTDSDSLPDGFEVLTLGTDPLKSDSDDNGTNDANEDADSDGLTNLREYQIGTNPLDEDTDDDGLNDYAEVNTYFTAPTDEDTDDDTLTDSDDVALGFSPLLQDTDDNGILDCDEKVEQTLNTDRIDESLLLNNYAVPTVLTVTAKGNINNNIYIDEYNGYLKGSERQYVGKPIEISGSEFETGTLKFTLSNDYIIKSYTTPDGITTNGLLICYNNGKETIPLITNYDEASRTLSAEISEPGYYFVFDFMQWVESLGLEATVNAETETITSKKSMKKSASIATVDVKGQVDIVFAIDTTGSMSSAINNVKSNITEFVNDLSEAGIKPSFALIDFKDITDDGSNSTHIVKNSESNWFTNTEQFKNKIAALTVNGGGDEPETPIDALEMARRLDTRSSSQKFIILITDANYKTNNNYEISSMNEMAELLKDDNINVSVISDTSYQAMYHTLYDTTGGVFADINGNFKAQLLTIADKIEEKTNDGYWILLEGLLPKIVKLDEKPDSAGTADTDGDGLLDREELKNVLPNKIVDVNYYYSILLKNTYETIGYKYSTIGVYQYNTDPTDKDTDKDSYNDFEDLMPLVPYKNPIILLHGWTDNTKNAFGLETKVTDENNNYGKQTADNDKEYSACSSHEITEITSGKLGAYLKNTKKYEENKNLFAFNYANQDMVYLNAAKLQAYVNDLISTAKMGNSDVVNQGYLFATKSNLNDSNVKFILVGHSMGGLVSRYYVENLSGESRIEKIITIDTPHYGSSLGNTSSALDFISYFMGKYNPGVFDLRTDSSLYGNGDTSWALTALYDYNMTYYALNHQSPALLGNANIETDYYSIAGYSIKSNNSAFDGTMYISYKLMKMIFAIKFINNTISKSDFYNTINNSLSNYSFQTVGEDSSVVFENIGSPGDDVVDIESQLGVKFDFWGNCVSYVNFKKSALIFDTTFSHNLLSNFHNDILNSEILFQQIGEFLND